jgi:hypothetical protein
VYGDARSQGSQSGPNFQGIDYLFVGLDKL